MFNRVKSVGKALVPLSVGLVSLAGVQSAATPTASAAGAGVSGVVVCASGQQVVGVWVDSPAGGSGFANFSRQPGAPHVAQYSRTVTAGGSVSLHVGCGGTPSSWRGDNWTPRIAIGGGRTVNTVCNDAAGTGVRCQLPPTGSTRSTNWFSAGYCTYGAAEKIKAAVGAYPNWSGNAYQWRDNAARAGWLVRPEAMPRSVFVMQPNDGTSSSLGHVGWVDWVEYRSDGAYIHTTEMNARGLGVWSNEVRKVLPSMRFILIP